MCSNRLLKAKHFALKMHKEQPYDCHPYHFHLQQVVAILQEFGVDDEDLLIAAWLHDVLEDSGIKHYKYIKQEWGEEIAEIVYCVTDELGRNRQEKKDKTYPKLKENKNAILVKLADRLANVRYGISQGCKRSKTQMYQMEYPEFKRNLFFYGGLSAMWEELDEHMGVAQLPLKDYIMGYKTERAKELVFA